VIRITAEQAAEGRTILRVEGRLIGGAIAALRDAIAAHRARGDDLTVDLGGVGYADRDALAFLRAERHRGTPLRNGTPFITYALED